MGLVLLALAKAASPQWGACLRLCLAGGPGTCTCTCTTVAVQVECRLVLMPSRLPPPTPKAYSFCLSLHLRCSADGVQMVIQGH